MAGQIPAFAGMTGREMRGESAAAEAMSYELWAGQIVFGRRKGDDLAFSLNLSEILSRPVGY